LPSLYTAHSTAIDRTVRYTEYPTFQAANYNAFGASIIIVSISAAHRAAVIAPIYAAIIAPIYSINHTAV
jgi:hypothetical protein